MDYAACAGMYSRRQGDPDIFFPAKRSEEILAKGICLSCPVKVECGNRGKKFNAVGIWGGETRSNK